MVKKVTKTASPRRSDMQEDMTWLRPLLIGLFVGTVLFVALL